MRIAESTIAHILARIDIVDVVSTYVKLKKAGKSYTACCPFHQEKSPSFHVTREKGFYHCFGCGVSGNAIGFVMAIENKPFLDVIEQMAQQAGVELPKREEDNALKYNKTKVSMPQKTAAASSAATSGATLLVTDAHTYMPAIPDDVSAWEHLEYDALTFNNITQWEDPAAEREGNLYELLEQVAQYYEAQFTQNYKVKHYIETRGVNDAMRSYWRLGYAPETTLHLTEKFAEDIEGLKLLGLVRTGDNGRMYCLLRDRLIFAIRNRSGKVIGFAGRALSDEVKPKYINSPESTVFHKSEVLFGLFEGMQARAKDWVMVEGYLDVIALHQAGIHGAVASMGTATNENHLQLLFKQSSRVTLAFDGDAAGQKAAWRTLEIALPTLTDGRELRFLVLPPQHDPDSLIRQEGVVAFRKRLEQAPPLSDFLYAGLQLQHAVSTTEGKSSLWNAAKVYTQQLPAQGTYRRLLEQAIREKLGLGWKNKAVQQKDQLLSFEQSSLEDKVLLLLLQYPSLALHLQELKTLISSDIHNPLYIALTLIENAQHTLPEDSEHGLFFLIGAWPNSHERRRICQLIDKTDVYSFIQRPEQLDGLCRELTLKLTEHALIRKMATLSLRDTVKKTLNLRLQEIRHQMQFREM